MNTPANGLSNSRPEAIVRAVEEDILHGVRRPGDRLEERQLATSFGVSRTPVREALQRLAASGLVEIRGRSGAIVAQLSGVELIDGFSVTAELEALAAAFAARRRLPAHLEKMTRAHEACAAAAETGGADDFYEANLRFHEQVAVASQSRVLQEQLRTVTIKTAPYRRYVTLQPGRMASSIPEHFAILDAIARGESDEAAERMRDHVMLLGKNAIDFLHFFHTGAMTS